MSSKRLKIIGGPYLDVDYSDTLYLTDTGRLRNGNQVSIKDKADPKQKQVMKQNQILKEKGYRIDTTRNIIKASNERALPDRIMFTIHPQHWHSSKILWTQELIIQNLKFFLSQISRQISSIRMDLFR